jgi:hypothetical protein
MARDREKTIKTRGGNISIAMPQTEISIDVKILPFGEAHVEFLSFGEAHIETGMREVSKKPTKRNRIEKVSPVVYGVPATTSFPLIKVTY